MSHEKREDYELKKLASKLLSECSEDKKKLYRALAEELGAEEEYEELLRGLD